AHDLDAGDDGRVMLLGNLLHRLLQYAIDAVLDDDRAVARLNVDVGGTPLQRGEDRSLDQANDRADVGLAREFLNRDGFVGVLVFADYIERKVFAGFFQYALRLLTLFQDIADLRERCDAGDDTTAQVSADFVEQRQITGIGDGDDHAAVLGLLQRDEVVAEHEVHFDLAEQLMLDVEALQVYELAAIPARHFFGVRHLIAGCEHGAVAAIYEYGFLICH